MDEYSGPFDPEYKAYERLSKPALIRLLKEACREMLGIDGYWYSLIEDRFGLELANELDPKFSKYMPRYMCKLLDFGVLKLGKNWAKKKLWLGMPKFGEE